MKDWLRCGVCSFTPISGFVQLLKINSQSRHEMGHQSNACAQQFQRTKKLRAATLRFANNVHLTESFNHGPNFKRVGSRLAISRFEKHLHACNVASHVVNRARDACCPQSLT